MACHAPSNNDNYEDHGNLEKYLLLWMKTCITEKDINWYIMIINDEKEHY